MKFMFVLRFAASDCKARFAGSFLGRAWAVINPIVTVFIYWFVYTVALKGMPIDGVPYVLWLISGIGVWFFLSDSICRASSCFMDYRFLIRKTSFNTKLLPIIRITSSAMDNFPFLAVAYILLIIGRISPSVGQLWAIYWFICGFVLNLAAAQILSIVCVYIKDLKYAIEVIVQLGFWITPVFWSPSALDGGLGRLCFLNPAAIVIDGFRNALIFGRAPDIALQLYFWAFVAALSITAYFVTKKNLPVIADRL